jgi:hypothetical protein
LAEDAATGKGSGAPATAAYSKRNRSALDDITNNYIFLADMQDRMVTRASLRAAQAQVLNDSRALVRVYFPYAVACPDVSSAGGAWRRARAGRRRVILPAVGSAPGRIQRNGHVARRRFRRWDIQATV